MKLFLFAIFFINSLLAADKELDDTTESIRALILASPQTVLFEIKNCGLTPREFRVTIRLSADQGCCSESFSNTINPNETFVKTKEHLSFGSIKFLEDCSAASVIVQEIFRNKDNREYQLRTILHSGIIGLHLLAE